VQRGANKQAKFSNDKSVLYLACVHGNEEVVKVLLQNGVEIDQRTYKGYTVLHCMCLADRVDLDVVRCLVAHGADGRILTRDGDNALHIASARGRLNIVKILVDEGGMDVSTKNLIGQTAFDLVPSKGNHLKLVASLLPMDGTNIALDTMVALLKDQPAMCNTGKKAKNAEPLSSGETIIPTSSRGEGALSSPRSSQNLPSVKQNSPDSNPCPPCSLL
jgi:ankyrin repeat protein